LICGCIKQGAATFYSGFFRIKAITISLRETSALFHFSRILITKRKERTQVLGIPIIILANLGLRF
ncbi:MAG: hypothetical protein UDM08_02305, partial [Eggerthellaceae bacterium]|nr:hypothetical protein [Eggerthellaceae bacterium]